MALGVSSLSLPFGGGICFQVETTYGAGVQAGTAYVISDAITDVRLESGDINNTLRTISSPSVADFSTVLVDPKLHVEWVFQPNVQAQQFEKLCVNRTNCDLSSMAIQIVANSCSTTSDLYYNCKGAKCESITISAAQGENWTCSADFSLSSVATSTATICTIPSALGATTYPYAAFNAAGSITWSPSDIAYITKAFSVTVNNNLSNYYTVGSSDKKAAIPGAFDVTGSCDISVDAGGYYIWPKVTAGTDITSLVLNSGRTAATGAGKITLTNGRFDSLGIDLNTSGEGMISSIPFKFKMLRFTAGT